MNQTNELRDFVAKYCKANNITQYAIYKRGNVAKGVVKRFFKGESVTVNSLNAILNEIGLKLTITCK